MKTHQSAMLAALALLAGSALASINLNSSRSNSYRLTYSSEVASESQVTAMLAELDRLGQADEAKLSQWLTANFKRFGIDGDRVKKLIILPRSKNMPDIGIILLTRPEDEAAARATTVKSVKSNSSD